MRVIGGRLKGLRLNPPAGLPVRPTTDTAKEALFNILNNEFDLETTRVLDLFSGTGNISIEFASRGVPEVTSADRDQGCYNYLTSVIKQHGLDNIRPYRTDAFKFLENETGEYDIIFADPPYDLPRMNMIASIVDSRKLLKAGGLLVIEHPALKKLDNGPNFTEQRNYGSSAFSFFADKQQ